MSIMDRYSLKGKVAIVTGASQGLGEAIAISLAEAGADLVLASRNVASMEKVAGDIKAIGRKALVVKADMLKVADIHNMVAKAKAEYGKIDILVNNAGISVVKPFVDISEEEFDRVMDTNLKAYYIASQIVGKIMLEQKSGVVIHNASIFGRIGFPNLSPYICSKSALVGLTKSMAVEWGRKGLRVLCIAPSYIRTELAKRDIETIPAVLDQNLKHIPMRRGGEPREVGDVVAFLASDAASFMSGETVAIDGGWLSM